MRWTVIVVSCKNGQFSHSFTFTGSHDKSMAFAEAQDHLRGQWLDVLAIVAGDHPVYNPSMGS
jgi:hypothetical protein